MIKSITSTAIVADNGELLFDVSVLHDDGSVIEKRMDINDYLGLFQNSVEEKYTYMEIPKLDDYIIKASVVPGKDDCFKVVGVLEAQKRQFCMKELGFMGLLPYPRLIFFLNIHKGARKEFLLFALDEGEINPETKLYFYPFGNVGRAGNCCFGNIHSEGKITINESVKIVEDFINGETNSHLYTNQNALRLKQGELIEYIKNRETYPRELLLDSGNTVDILFKKIK